MRKLLITVILGVVAIVSFLLRGNSNQSEEQKDIPMGAIESVLPDEESLFAEVDAEGNVLRVIVIDAKTLASGRWGDPKNWIRTYANGRLRKNYAGQGFKYDKVKDIFIPFKPYNSWSLDDSSGKWKAPIPKPTDSNDYYWSESSQSWKKFPIK